MKKGDIQDISPNIHAATLKNAEFEGVSIPIPRMSRPICENGWVGPDDPQKATAEWGEKMLTTIADYIARFVKEFQNAPVK